jgi:radical SAM superfamily enzyme YgiQ (UPF0313 family)
MKILFITPPYNDQFLMPEIGIPQLKSYLTKNNILCDHKDLNNDFIYKYLVSEGAAVQLEQLRGTLTLREHGQAEFSAALRKRNPVYEDFFGSYIDGPVRELRPDILGISVVDTPQLYPSCLLIREVKRRFPGLFTVIGGPWATTAREIVPEFVRSFPELDGVITHAGEGPLLALCRAIERKGDFSTVPNLIWRNGTDVVTNPLAPPVPLDDIPTPDFSDLPLDRYRAQVLPIATRSGCYWGRCVFCHHNVESAWNSQATPERVVDSMEQLVRQTGLNHFFLADTCTDPAFMREMGGLLRARNSNVRWSCMTRIENCYDREYCRILADSGCHTIFFGLESVVPELLRRTRKGISVDTLDSILLNLHEVGIWANLFVIHIPSFPVSDLERTLAWIVERKELVNHVITQTFVLARNTKVWETPEELDLVILPGAERDLDVFHLPYATLREGPTADIADIVGRFSKQMFVPSLENNRRTRPWILCGRD